MWSWRFFPTPGRSTRWSIPCLVISLAGPTPDLKSIWGDPNAPEERITSFEAFNVKVIEFLYFNHPEFDTLVTIEAESDEIVSAACNLVYASGSFNSFTWFRAFEADEWKDIYQTASNNMASYISAKQRAEEE